LRLEHVFWGSISTAQPSSRGCLPMKYCQFNHRSLSKEFKRALSENALLNNSTSVGSVIFVEYLEIIALKDL